MQASAERRLALRCRVASACRARLRACAELAMFRRSFVSAAGFVRRPDIDPGFPACAGLWRAKDPA